MTRLAVAERRPRPRRGAWRPRSDAQARRRRRSPRRVRPAARSPALNPRRAASRRRRSRPLTARSSPSSPTSPMTTVSAARSAGRAATRRAPGRSAGPGPARRRSGRRRGWRTRRGCPGRSRRAGRGRRRAGRAGSGRARSPCAPACRSRPARRAPGPRRGAAGCPRASARRRCPAPARDARPGTRGPDRSTSSRPCAGHLEDADLLGRAEAVLGRADQPQRRVALALDRDDRVDEVLEGLGPGDRAVLGHVPDEDDRDALALGEVHQADGRLADLADAAGRAVELVDRRGLDRVDDDERRSHAVGRPRRSTRCRARPGPRRAARDRPRAGRAARRAGGPGRPTPRRSRTAPAAADAGGDLEQQRRLADPGLAADAGRASPGTSPPPSTRSSSPMPVGQRAGRRPRRCRPGRPAIGGPGPTATLPRASVARAGSRTTVSTRLFQVAARPALAFPAQEVVAARLADESTRGLGRHAHSRTAAGIRRLRRARASRRRGCPGRPPGPCRRRSSCPARSGPAGGARPARPRSCSG